MNADDRTPPSGEGLYTPRQAAPTTGTSPTRRAFMPVTSEHATEDDAPGAASAPGQAPTSGTVPQRTALRPQSAPQGIPAGASSPAPRPVPAQAPTRPVASAPAQAAPAQDAPTRPVPAQAAPAASTSTGAPASTGGSRFDGALGAGQAALGAGTARIKGLAGRAAESFKAGDDLATPTSKGGPRKARVLLSRIDPWSALKIGFLLSIAMGIMLVVAVFVLWNVLNGMGVFALVNEWVQKLFTTDQELNIMQFFDRNKVMSAAILVSVVNVVLLTALATIGAFLYNVVSSVVGGIYVTLTDD